MRFRSRLDRLEQRLSPSGLVLSVRIYKGSPEADRAGFLQAVEGWRARQEAGSRERFIFLVPPEWRRAAGLPY